MARAFLRITIIVAISIVVLSICFGGLSDWNSFEVVGSLLAIFWGIPLFIFFAICPSSSTRRAGVRAKLVLQEFSRRDPR